MITEFVGDGLDFIQERVNTVNQSKLSDDSLSSNSIEKFEYIILDADSADSSLGLSESGPQNRCDEHVSYLCVISSSNLIIKATICFVCISSRDNF